MVPEKKNGEFLLYQSDDGQLKIQVRLEQDTVWLSQADLVELFQSSKSNISEHIKHVLKRVNWWRIQLFGNSEQLPRMARTMRSFITIWM